MVVAVVENPGALGGDGGNGGSGVVIVRYQIGSVASAKATGGSVSFYGLRQSIPLLQLANLIIPLEVI